MSEKTSKKSGILLAVAALMVFAVIIFVAWGKTEDKSENDNSKQKTTEETKQDATTEAGKMGANEIAITAANFDAEVVKSDKLTLVDAFAPWCPHCQKLSPIFTRLSDEYVGKVKFGKMNSDNQDKSVKDNFDFAVQNGLQGYPTVWFYKGGKKVDEFSGEKTYEELKALIEKNK